MGAYEGRSLASNGGKFASWSQKTIEPLKHMLNLTQGMQEEGAEPHKALLAKK